MSLTPDEAQRINLRLRAMAYDIQAARAKVNAAACRAAVALNQLVETWRRAEVATIRAHPDLTELDLQLDGFYGDPMRGSSDA